MRIRNALHRGIASLFASRPEETLPWLNRGFVLLVYLAGLGLWAYLLNGGRIPFDFHDWAEVNAARLAFVRNALITGQLPLHMNSSSFLRGLTDRYFMLPDVIFTPQMLLLRWMQVGPWLLVNIWLLYTAGMAALLWLCRRYQVSVAVFAVVALLFNFNGHIVSHLMVGHVTWGGYFLLPWFAGLMLALSERPQGWPWIGQMALCLLLILLQGSFHQFVWGLMFLGLFGLFYWPRLLTCLAAGASAGLLGAFRLLPPALGLGQFSTEFLGGYPSLVWLAKYVLLRYPPESIIQPNYDLSRLGGWEFDLYTGLMGAVFIGLFGVLAWLIRARKPGGFANLLLPCLALFVLSIDQVYAPIARLNFPLLSAERVTSRMISLPFVIVLLLAGIFFQRWYSARPRTTLQGVAGLAGLALIAYDLLQHARLWRVERLFPLFPTTPVDLARVTVANHPDPAYTNLLWIGLLVSLVSGAVLVLFARNTRSKDSLT